MSSEESIERLGGLVGRLESVRTRLESTDDPEVAIEVLAELAEIAKQIEAELAEAKRRAEAEADAQA